MKFATETKVEAEAAVTRMRLSTTEAISKTTTKDSEIIVKTQLELRLKLLITSLVVVKDGDEYRLERLIICKLFALSNFGSAN